MFNILCCPQVVSIQTDTFLKETNPKGWEYVSVIETGLVYERFSFPSPEPQGQQQN